MIISMDKIAVTDPRPYILIQWLLAYFADSLFFLATGDLMAFAIRWRAALPRANKTSRF